MTDREAAGWAGLFSSAVNMKCGQTETHLHHKSLTRKSIRQKEKDIQESQCVLMINMEIAENCHHDCFESNTFFLGEMGTCFKKTIKTTSSVSAGIVSSTKLLNSYLSLNHMNPNLTPFVFQIEYLQLGLVIFYWRIQRLAYVPKLSNGNYMAKNRFSKIH